MAVIPVTVVELRLQLRQLFLGSLETLTLLVGCVLNAPDVVQICPYLQEHTRAPLIPAEALVTVVIPILRGHTQSEEHHGKQSCHNDLLHNSNSPFDSECMPVHARRSYDDRPPPSITQSCGDYKLLDESCQR